MQRCGFVVLGYAKLRSSRAGPHYRRGSCGFCFARCRLRSGRWTRTLAVSASSGQTGVQPGRVLDPARRAPGMPCRYGIGVTVAGIGNARDGFVYHPDGLDLGSVLAAASGGRPITEQPGARAWPTAIDGLRATEADLLVEVTDSSPATGEPGLTHMREALRRGIPVVTSSKWPVALHGLELAELARARGVAFRADQAAVFGRQLRRDQVACQGHHRHHRPGSPRRRGGWRATASCRGARLRRAGPGRDGYRLGAARGAASRRPARPR